jgi:hypothetical protein
MKEKRIRVLKVEPLKKPEVCYLDNNLDALQKAVSIGADYQGLIEVLDLSSKVCIILNEEGKLIGLEPNRRIEDDIICGVFYVTGQNRSGNFISLSDEQITHYSEIFADIEYFSADDVGNTIVVKFIEI